MSNTVGMESRLLKEYRLIGMKTDANKEDFNDDKKDAGELGSGQYSHCFV